jgi:hypothetical protein
VREALRQAALDTQPLVQNAAEGALERLLKLEPVTGNSLTAIQSRLRQRVGATNGEEQLDLVDDLREPVGSSARVETASAHT